MPTDLSGILIGSLMKLDGSTLFLVRFGKLFSKSRVPIRVQYRHFSGIVSETKTFCEFWIYSSCRMGWAKAWPGDVPGYKVLISHTTSCSYTCMYRS